MYILDRCPNALKEKALHLANYPFVQLHAATEASASLKNENPFLMLDMQFAIGDFIGDRLNGDLPVRVDDNRMPYWYEYDKK